MSTSFIQSTLRQVSLVLSIGAVMFVCSTFFAQAFDAGQAESNLTSAPASVEAGLQAKIEMLMKRIAELQQGRSGQGIVKKPETGTSLPLLPQLFRIIQTTKKINSGEQDTPAAKVTVAKSSETRYINEVKMRVVPLQKNKNAVPWESFDEMSVWLDDNKVIAMDVQDSSKWKTITTEKGKKIYELTVFSGNVPIPAEVALKATLAVTSSNDVTANEGWTIWIPKNGVTVWTEAAKHKKYGPSKAFTYMIVGEEDEVEEEAGAVLGASTSATDQELQAQIAALMAQIAALKQDTSTGGVPTTPQRSRNVTLSFVSTQTNLENPETDPSGDYNIEFDVAAIDSDVYIPTSVKRLKALSQIPKVGVEYRISDSDGKIVKSGTASAAIASIADKESDYYVIHEGESEELDVNVWFKPAKAGSYRVELLTLNWTDRVSGKLKRIKFDPTAGFKTDYLTVPTL